MALPVLAGLGWLLSQIVSAFVALMTFIAASFSKKFLLKAAVLASFAVLVTAFYLIFDGLIDSISHSLPSTVLSLAAHIVPGNFNACLSFCISGRLVRWGFDWKVKAAQMMAD